MSANQPGRARLRRVGWILLKVLWGLGAAALVVATLMPFIHTDQWWVRTFDFPRLQFAVLLVVVLLGYVAMRIFGRFRRWEYVLPAMVLLALLWQMYAIFPYTLLMPRQVADSKTAKEESRLSLIISNVLYDSREVGQLLELIRRIEPDMVLLTEPTAWWREQLETLEETFPHTVLQDQENEYGMLLYSRLELINPEVRFLAQPEVPSIRTGVRLRSGEEVLFYGVHPRPPGLKPAGERERSDSDTRDAELLLIAREIKPLGGQPVIVAGDFNDVAWSRSTHLFQRVGGLLDPRVGRGLFNSFDADHPFLRYPLDHVFVSDHFRLTKLQRLPHIGSDHFPILAILDFDPGAAAAQDEPQSDAEDKETAGEAIEEGT
ncbi:MAG: endonuclease/exonuclease/phosphatase family protein [Opitutales bacterium]